MQKTSLKVFYTLFLHDVLHFFFFLFFFFVATGHSSEEGEEMESATAPPVIPTISLGPARVVQTEARRASPCKTRLTIGGRSVRVPGTSWASQRISDYSVCQLKVRG